MKRYKNYVMKKSREHKTDQFYDECQTECNVLDVGVAMETEDANQERNHFLKNFKFSKGFYTGIGIEDLSKMPTIHPGFKFYTYDGIQLPFDDKYFDIIWSNAVIEHVGSDRQLNFLNEMIRVSKKVFLTTPNKFFPVETHTTLVFLHYFDIAFYAYLHKYTDYNERNLQLFSYKKLYLLLKSSHAKRFCIVRNKYFGLTMTFSVIVE